MESKKVKHYIEANVYEEAKKRIKHIIEAHDKVYVMFSGGKDSLTILKLTEEVYKEMGITEKITVVFRDEELIPDDVINFVTEYYRSGKYDFRYYAVPLKSTKFILGKSYDYIQWDNSREWIRPKPDFAITLPEGDKRVFSQYDMDAFIAGEAKGKIAFIVGVRTDESLIRLMTCIVKKNENYINTSSAPNISLCKPIFDWTQDDVFLYFYRNNIKYCGIYDLQIINGQQLRVATPLLAENAKRIGKLRTLYPLFYEQILSMFPEMLVQEKYWDSLDRFGIMERYEHSWNGVMKYIKENVEEGHQRKLAIKRLFECKTARENKLKRGEGYHNFGGYPILYVFKNIISGKYKRGIQPQSKSSRNEIEYEGGLESNPQLQEV